MPPLQTITARIVQGHRVASGLNGNPRFPGGTLKMQEATFLTLGFDLTAYHRGTLNVSLAPFQYRVIKAPITYRQVKWHPVEPAEDFSLFDIQVRHHGGPVVAGKIYHSHPETKPEHFQKPDVLELLLPFVPGIQYGDEIQLTVPTDQMVLEEVPH